MAVTKIADIVNPVIFLPYVQQETEVKSNLIRSGALIADEALNTALLGAGSTFNEPSFNDLPDEDANVSSDDDTVKSIPAKVISAKETQVRLSRNKSFSGMDLAADLAGKDPLGSVVARVGSYITRRLQSTFIATMKGVFADNAAAPTGTEHVINDMTVNISGASYVSGVTNFSPSSVVDAKTTMGDSMDDLKMIFVHSIIYGRMLKNALIAFMPDAQGIDSIPTFNGMTVIVDDSMPVNSGVFESWLFGAGSVRLGQGSPKVPVENLRDPAAGNGGGMDTLFYRWDWIIHPVGYAYVGTATQGVGPSNAATSGNLAHADSWKRAFPERKQIKIARLITREY